MLGTRTGVIFRWKGFPPSVFGKFPHKCAQPMPQEARGGVLLYASSTRSAKRGENVFRAPEQNFHTRPLYIYIPTRAI